MRVLGFLAPVVAVLVAGVIAQTDPLQVLAQIPACTVSPSLYLCLGNYIFTFSVARMRCQSAHTSELPIDGPGELSLHEYHFTVDICSLRSGIMRSRRPSQYDDSLIQAVESLEPNIDRIFNPYAD